MEKQTQNHCSEDYDTLCEAVMPFPVDVMANNKKQIVLCQWEWLSGENHREEKDKNRKNTASKHTVHMQQQFYNLIHPV